jgi:hypothetical protein
MYIQVYVLWQRFETRALSPRNFGHERRKSFCDASMGKPGIWLDK